MTQSRKDNRAWLLATAKAVAEQLKLHAEGTQLRVRIPRGAAEANTDGWSSIIGDLGKGKPRLGVWLDRFSGHDDRKLYAGFHSSIRQQITTIAKRVDEQLWPARVITPDDFDDDSKFVVLEERLERSLFNIPILEKHVNGQTFYGIYDPTRQTKERVSPHFCARVVAFFEDVARALPNAKRGNEQTKVYAQFENRQQVVSHLHRERSQLLAAECKIRDDFECQVCGFRFEQAYGGLGKDFAEAHHRVPLAQLRENVRTRIEHLITVCANCHRMLHRMEGKSGDVTKLRAIVRKHQA